MKTTMKLIMTIIIDLLFFKLYNSIDYEFRFMTAWFSGALSIGMIFFIDALFDNKEGDDI